VIVDECEDCQQEEEIVGLSSAAKELVEEEEDGETKNVQDSSIDMRTMESGCDAHECKHPNHQSDAEKMETSLAFAIDEDAVAADETAPARHQPPVNFPLAISILLGDAIHNFTDGVFLGNSFLLCSRDIAWTMVATTIYHELAQELADYVLLTSHCGLPIWKALLANFLSGLSVLFGALVILAADLSDQATGVILAISAGVYLHITAVECLPRVMEITKAKRRLFLLFLGMFVLGAVPIGLVLLNHGHCA
jgi:zinc transporter ZupT